MAGDLLTVEDTINGLEGRVIIEDGTNRRVLAEVTNVTVTYTIEKAQQKVMGRRNSLSKAIGASGTGTMTVLYGASEFANMMLTYQRTGKLPFFGLLVENNDKASDRAPIRRMYKKCSIDSLELSKLDVGEAYLSQDVPFTWEEFENV